MQNSEKDMKDDEIAELKDKNKELVSANPMKKGICMSQRSIRARCIEITFRQHKTIVHKCL